MFIVMVPFFILEILVLVELMLCELISSLPNFASIKDG